MTRVVVEKALRRLTVYDEAGNTLLRCLVALGSQPVGQKQAEGDGRTPEGDYFICLKRETGKFGCALGISYPSLADAQAAAEQGRLDAGLLPLFEKAEREGRRPPWGTPLGGEICLHGGGAARDWTAGCVALDDEDMRALFVLCSEGDPVTILK
ncbi:MAG: L,D-transpeptidase [Clostridia bacterium]|nr:L,D-transpeptidase [Clostridia bacterium]